MKLKFLLLFYDSFRLMLWFMHVQYNTLYVYLSILQRTTTSNIQHTTLQQQNQLIKTF